MRGALPECAENRSCIPEAPRSWGVGAWGGGEGGKRRGDAQSLGEKGGAPAPGESREPSPGARGGRRLQPAAAPARGESGGRGRGRGARLTAGCVVGEGLRLPPLELRGGDGKVNPEKVHSLMGTRSGCSGGWEPGKRRQDSGSAGGCVCEGEARCQGGRRGERLGRAEPRPGGAHGSAGGGGRGAPRAAGGREGAAAGGALGPSWPGRGGGGEPGAGPRRRRTGLAPDLTFWVRACVPEARWGRGWGREAVREVPGWLASAPFSFPPSPRP